MRNEMSFVNDKDLRNEYIDKVEVLEKVRNLLLLLDDKIATRSMVAEFYNVTEGAIRQIENRHADEVDSDGFRIETRIGFRDFVTNNLYETKIDKNKGFDKYTYKNSSFKVGGFGVAIYTKRAILRVGMLLQNSSVSESIRDQILNIESLTDNNLKVKYVESELDIRLGISDALINGDSDKIPLLVERLITVNKNL